MRLLSVPKCLVVVLLGLPRVVLADYQVITYTPVESIQLRYAISASSFHDGQKLPLWIFQPGDGNIIDTFQPNLYQPMMEQLSRTFGVAMIMPELRRNLYVNDLKAYCQLDFFHRIVDLNGLIESAKKLDFVDASHIILFGHSGGGEIVTLTAKTRSDIQDVVTYGTGVVSLGETGQPLPPKELFQNDCSDPSKYWQRSGTFWQQLLLESKLFSTIKSLSIPYLAMFGASDPNVRFDDSKKYIGRLQDIKGNFSFEVFPGLDHGGYVQPQVWQKVERWSKPRTSGGPLR